MSRYKWNGGTKTYGSFEILNSVQSFLRAYVQVLKSLLQLSEYLFLNTTEHTDQSTVSSMKLCQWENKKAQNQFAMNEVYMMF